MTSRSMYIHAERFKQIIKGAGRIHKYDLIEAARISLSLYEKLKPWFEYRFRDFVNYDRSTKEWEWIAPSISTQSQNETGEGG